MKLSIVIVNYNVQFFLENCLNSVYNALQNIDAEVFVVDNNSVDNSMEMVKEKFPGVIRIENKINLGFSKANNQAIKMAKGQYILLLNPDTVVEEKTFQVCIHFFDNNEKAGGLGVKMLDGKGKFLPESKRGLPTPKVAFYKIFGLSSLFPKSEKYGQYHLGYLDKDKNHKIEVLSGAFMLLRKNVLDTIGLLDEDFFMYGEDIDLSYRISKAGFQNYYLADTSIIHYKGESTKKSSINYVIVFYKAMVIFARKHFSNKNAQIFSTLINLAIYLRASVALITRTIKHISLPVIDAGVIIYGVWNFKNYYENEVKYSSGGSYPHELDEFGIPIITGLFVLISFLWGSYLLPSRFSRIVKAVFSSSLVILLCYSLLDESYRYSRAIVLFALAWGIVMIPLLRLFLHQIGLFKLAKTEKQRIAIVGKEDELIRITSVLKDTLIEPDLCAYIKIDGDGDKGEEEDLNFVGKLSQLNDIIDIYSINEVIFCSKNLSSEEIIIQMSKLNSELVDFKIAPPESLYIIGSNSNQSSGEYYIIGANTIMKPINKQNKRLLDFCLSICLIFLSPFLLLIGNSPKPLYRNLFKILIGDFSFVGIGGGLPKKEPQLKIKHGILAPSNRSTSNFPSEEITGRLNLEYCRQYSMFTDLELIAMNLKRLDRK